MATAREAVSAHIKGYYTCASIGTRYVHVTEGSLLSGLLYSTSRKDSQFGGSIIMTNELDLDDLDDLESVYGQSRNVAEVVPNQSRRTVGFNENAKWNEIPQNVPAMNPVQEGTLNPFDELALKSSRPSGSPPRVTFADPPVSSRRSAEPRRQKQQSPAPIKPLAAPLVQAAKPAVAPAAPKPKDPFDDLNVPVDLLSAPVPHALSPPLPAASALNDPFANLEPLEPIVPMHCQPTTKIVGTAQGTVSSAAVNTVTTQGNGLQGLQQETSDQASYSMASPFLGEAKTHASSPPLPTRNHNAPFGAQKAPLVGDRRAYSPQPNPTFGGVGTVPILSMHSTGAPLHPVSKGPEVSGKGGWPSPQDEFTDIDKMLYQQVETLKTSGATATGATNLHRGGLNNLPRKVSMKDARASIGTG